MSAHAPADILFAEIGSRGYPKPAFTGDQLDQPDRLTGSAGYGLHTTSDCIRTDRWQVPARDVKL